LIVMTRRVQKLRRFPALWAVTWWPICNRDGQPVEPPTPATHAYAEWKSPDDHSDDRSNGQDESGVSSLRPSGSITPTIGVETPSHHSDLTPKQTSHHSDSRRNSQISGRGQGLAQQLADVRLADLIAVARAHPEFGPAELAQHCRATAQDVHRALQRLHAEAMQ
jgi:hypothetical protein